MHLRIFFNVLGMMTIHHLDPTLTSVTVAKKLKWGTNGCFQYFDYLQHLKGNVVSTKSNPEIKTGMSNFDSSAS
jgi:hypothetical protein